MIACGAWGPDGGATQVLVALFVFCLPMLGFLALCAYSIRKDGE